VWVPPSPREIQRGKSDRDSVVPPAKPPPPMSPLRHKNSFKNEKSLEEPAGATGAGQGHLGPPGGPSAFCSLPRHFHTENSYKARPARPPSMFGVPPPAPPTVPYQQGSKENTQQELPKAEEEEEEKSKPANNKPETEEPRKLIGFEVVEQDLKEKEDEVGEVVLRKKDEVLIRPVPAPRSSLLLAGGERPQLMAKPRDLSKRTMHGSGGGTSQTGVTTEGSGSSSEDINGGTELTNHTVFT